MGGKQTDNGAKWRPQQSQESGLSHGLRGAGLAETIWRAERKLTPCGVARKASRQGGQSRSLRRLPIPHLIAKQSDTKVQSRKCDQTQLTMEAHVRHIDEIGDTKHTLIMFVM